MKKSIFILTAVFGLAATTGRADAIIINFANNNITGGTLNLLETGTDPATDFGGDRFDELVSADFQITDLPTYTVLNITATALLDDLNVLSGGLADGSTGYNSAGEGTSFVFDKDVIITTLDWASFTTDSVTLRNGGSSLGTFTTGTNTGGIDFTNSNPATMNINVSAGDAFQIEFAGGDFELESMGLTVIPEPSSLALVGIAMLLFYKMLRGRKS